MKSIIDVENEIVREFLNLPDIDARYEYLFQLADKVQPLDPPLKTDENLVEGCQSKVWFHLHDNNGQVFLETDSDSMVIKGITALLTRIVNGRHPEEINQISLDFIDKIQIWKLPSQRNNGLLALLQNLKVQANNYLKVRSEGNRVDNE
jgi:cysteine desulfuration protein SufE